jgi:hypothetical protein
MEVSVKPSMRSAGLAAFGAAVGAATGWAGDENDGRQSTAASAQWRAAKFRATRILFGLVIRKTWNLDAPK